jgi:hypothetical protein
MRLEAEMVDFTREPETVTYRKLFVLACETGTLALLRDTLDMLDGEPEIYDLNANQSEDLFGEEP